MSMTENTVDKSAEIKVTVAIPDKVSESVKRHKINRLYDLLKPKTNEKT